MGAFFLLSSFPFPLSSHLILTAAIFLLREKFYGRPKTRPKEKENCNTSTPLFAPPSLVNLWTIFGEGRLHQVKNRHIFSLLANFTVSQDREAFLPSTSPLSSSITLRIIVIISIWPFFPLLSSSPFYISFPGVI